MKTLFHLGRYILFMGKVFKRPQKTNIFVNNIFFEIEKLGINSIIIVFIISVFMGAVITLQTAYNIEAAYVPLYLVGLGTRDSMFLEFSSTILLLEFSKNGVVPCCEHVTVLLISIKYFPLSQE